MNLKGMYLHWGPGGNAEVERRWFGNTLPIDWWDQPKVSGPSAFDEIVSTAKARLFALSDQAGSSIELIAHSFGGQIAIRLAREAPDRISGITLVSCGHSATRSFIHLGRKLASGHPGIRELSDRAESSRAPGDFWSLVGAVANVPNFQRCYWWNEERQKRYLELAAGFPLFDLDVFQDVMNVFLGNTQTQTSPVSLPENVEVRSFLGRFDPLQQLEEEVTGWSEQFPGRCSTHVLDAGHFVPFECDPEVWLPGRLIT